MPSLDDLKKDKKREIYAKNNQGNENGSCCET